MYTEIRVETKMKVKSIYFFILVTLFSSLNSVRADNSIYYLRSCFASEMALIMLEHADQSKSYDENVDIGKRFGYVIGGIYQDAILSLPDPESAALDIVEYAMGSAPERARLMSVTQLKADVNKCRSRFQ